MPKDKITHKMARLQTIFSSLDLDVVGDIALGRRKSDAVKYYTNDGVVLNVPTLFEELGFSELPMAPIVIALAEYLTQNGWDTQTFGMGDILVTL